MNKNKMSKKKTEHSGNNTMQNEDLVKKSNDLIREDIKEMVEADIKKWKKTKKRIRSNKEEWKKIADKILNWDWNDRIRVLREIIDSEKEIGGFERTKKKIDKWKKEVKEIEKETRELIKEK